MSTIQQITKINDNQEIYQDFLDSHFKKEITTEVLISKHGISKYYIRRCKSYVRGKEKLAYAHETFSQPQSNPSFEKFKKEIDNLTLSGDPIIVNKVSQETKLDHETVRSCLCYYAGLYNDLNWLKFK